MKSYQNCNAQNFYHLEITHSSFHKDDHFTATVTKHWTYYKNEATATWFFTNMYIIIIINAILLTERTSFSQNRCT